MEMTRKEDGDDIKECSSHARAGGNLELYVLLVPRIHGDGKKKTGMT
jgi:hypothetical protein